MLNLLISHSLSTWWIWQVDPKGRPLSSSTSDDVLCKWSVTLLHLLNCK
jgi:hypothetical protein